MNKPKHIKFKQLYIYLPIERFHLSALFNTQQHNSLIIIIIIIVIITSIKINF